MTPAHHMIHVRDFAGAIDFYTSALCAVVADRHAYDGTRLAYLRWPDSAFELELVCPDTWPFADGPEPGRTHIAFTVDDLDREHARLSALGLSPDPVSDYRANDIHQTRYFYLCDPEGNQIELLEAQGRYAIPRS